MKIIIAILFLLTPYFSIAQESTTYNQAEMQDMMQLMQKVQQCMLSIDQSQLQALEQQSQTFETELKALCKQGKRQEAQTKAISFSKEILNNQSLKQMQKCSEITKGLLPEKSNKPFVPEFDFSNRHVCDEKDISQ